MSQVILLKQQSPSPASVLDKLFAAAFSELDRTHYPDYAAACAAVHDAYNNVCTRYRNSKGRAKMQELRQYSIDPHRVGFFVDCSTITLITLKPQL